MLSNAAKGHDLRSSRQLLKVTSLRPQESCWMGSVVWVGVELEPVGGQ